MKNFAENRALEFFGYKLAPRKNAEKVSRAPYNRKHEIYRDVFRKRKVGAKDGPLHIRNFRNKKSHGKLIVPWDENLTTTIGRRAQR